MLPYSERADQLGLNDYETVRNSILTPFSYFFSWNGSYFWDFLNGTCLDYHAFWDHEIFVGGIGTLALLIMVVQAIHLRLGLKNKQFEISSQQKNIVLVGILCVSHFYAF